LAYGAVGSDLLQKQYKDPDISRLRPINNLKKYP